MGFIDTSTWKYLPVFYNVVHAVGRQCPNMCDDVKLIQYLLIAFYDKAPAQTSIVKPPGELTVTGVCGLTTMNWILDFQRDVRRSNEGYRTLDGRIDRVRNKAGIGSISHARYTLATLNRGVVKFNPDAFTMAPSVIPLENPMNVPPPSNDMVKAIPTEPVVPATAGF